MIYILYIRSARYTKRVLYICIVEMNNNRENGRIIIIILSSVYCIRPNYV